MSVERWSTLLEKLPEIKTWKSHRKLELGQSTQKLSEYLRSIPKMVQTTAHHEGDERTSVTGRGLRS